MLKKIIKNTIFKNKHIASCYYNLRDYLLTDDRMNKTQWGFWMSGNKDMQSGVFEPDETIEILNLLKDTDIFINIGANIGYYCLHALNLNKYVIAIEPNDKNLKKLMLNVLVNKYDKNIEIYQSAVGSEIGIQSLWGSGTGASLKKGWAGNSEFYSNLVPINTIDNIIAGRFENKRILILVDVEGFEYEVLIGARGVCSRQNPPQWVMEITTTQNQPIENPFNINFKDTFDEFYQYGYRSFVMGENLREIYRNEIAEININKIQYPHYNFYFKKND